MTRTSTLITASRTSYLEPKVRAFARRAACLLVSLVAISGAWAQEPATPPPAVAANSGAAPPAPLPSIPVVTFAFDRPGLPVPDFVISIGATNGHYAGQEVAKPARSTDPAAAPQPFGRPFTISQTSSTKIFALTRSLHNFNVPCASKAKNIADTGKKRLTYAGPDGHGECTYNYSENKDVQALTDIFQGIAATLDEGRRLEFLHRYDHLGLDAELQSFAGEVAEGRALEVGTIAETLRSLTTDERLMQRVRTRAAGLLAKSPSAP